MDADRPVATRDPPVTLDDVNAGASGVWRLGCRYRGEGRRGLHRVEETNGRVVAVLGWHGDLEVRTHCRPDGVVSLTAMTMAGFRMVCVPRVWDSPGRRGVERDPRKELGRLARRFETALDVWTRSVSELAAWIRYSPAAGGRRYPE